MTTSTSPPEPITPRVLSPTTHSVRPVTGTIDNGHLQVAAVHVIPEVVAAAKFQYVVNSVKFTTDNAQNVYPIVTFSVVDPTNGNSPYNILTATAFTGTDPGTGKPVCANGGTARLAIDIAWRPAITRTGAAVRHPPPGVSLSHSIPWQLRDARRRYPPPRLVDQIPMAPSL